MTRRSPTACVAVLGLALAALLTACVRGPDAPVGPQSAPPGVRPGLGRADEMRRAGREDEAVAIYREAVEAQPDSVPAHMRHIATLLALGRGSEARAWYQARAGRPGATSVERVMAQRLASDGASSSLRRIYTAASLAEPQEAWWHLALAEVEIAEADAWNGRRLAAVERVDRGEEKKAYAQARGAQARAGRALAEAARLAGTLAEVDLYLGLLRAVEGDLHGGAVASAAAYRAAEAAFVRATTRDADLVEAWEGLGDVRLRVGDLRGSLEAWLEAAERAPADPRLREAVGVALHRIGRYREAGEQYLEAARLAPYDAGPWVRLGDARAEDERWDPALEAYAEALRRDPRAIESHYKQGVIHEHRGHLAEARAAYERYIAADGEKASAVRRRVERLLQAGTGGR